MNGFERRTFPHFRVALVPIVACSLIVILARDDGAPRASAGGNATLAIDADVSDGVCAILSPQTHHACAR